MVLLNTIYLPEEKRLPIMKVISVAPLFAEAMTRVHNNGSVSALFDR
jgi:ribose-phosphate pyrophosphokinase